jgi:Phage integrase, N-terminal SAM-like domain
VRKFSASVRARALAEQSQHFLPEISPKLKTNEKQTSAHFAGFHSPANDDIALDGYALAVHTDETEAFTFSETGIANCPALQFSVRNTNVAPATPPKRRRGKCMSRRRGQLGREEKSGRWYVARFWIDVPGQEKREYARRKICPISGSGSLNASERLRKRKEIIAASGADTAEHFNKCQAVSSGTTFRKQAERWLQNMRTRKRKPLATATLENWESCLKNWLNPNIGDLPLSDINNAALKGIVAKMSDGGLSPKSINNYAQVVKMVVASAVNEQGSKSICESGTTNLLTCPW